MNLHEQPARKALRDYLEADNNDPRAELLHKNANGSVYRMAAENSGNVYQTDPFTPAGGHTNTFDYDFKDGTQLSGDAFTGPKGTHWALRWQSKKGPYTTISRAVMEHEEFKNWLKKFEPRVKSAIAKRTAMKLDRKSAWIRAKIAKIMKDGLRGKKVDQKQAEAVAYAMWEKHGGKDNG